MTNSAHKAAARFACLLMLWLLGPALTAPAGPAAHVVVIGVDGLGAAGVRNAEAPTLRQHWKDFGRLLETNAPNVLRHVKDAIETAEAAIKNIRGMKPDFLFVHFDGVDHAGHAFGWNSRQYLKAVELTDALISGILDVIAESGLKDNTVVLVTADHGGKGTQHGGASPGELEIPWLLSGPGVAAGREIQSVVNTYDTAPTLALLLGVKPPACWIGRPVSEAFAETGPKSKAAGP